MNDIFTPLPPSPTKRRHSASSSSSRRHSYSSVPIPIPQPTYVRPTHRQNTLGISNMSPSLSIAEIMSMSTPPLSPSSSSTSMTYPSSPDTPSSPSRLIFFPPPLHFDEEEEEDVFAATPPYRSPIKRSITDEFGSIALGLGLGMGSNGIDRLPDEPFYPQSTFRGFDTSLPFGSSTSPSSQGVGGGTNQLLPSAIPCSSSTSTLPQESPNQKERRKPFGHSFLPPLPASQKGIPTPLVPMGFLSPPPPSLWRVPAKAQSPTKNGSSPKSPLRRTDSDILLPSSYEEELVEEQEKLKRPIKLNGHMRKSSNDSEMTIKLGNGFVALGRNDSLQDSEYGSNGYSDGKGNGDFRSYQPLNYPSSYTTGYCTARRPNMSRHVSQQNPTIPSENYTAPGSAGGRYRSSSTSNVIPRPLQQEIKRPSSPTPYKPRISSPLHQNGIARPSSPIPFAMDEDYLHQDGTRTSGDGLQIYSTSRFTRPISPSLPEDLLTPHTNANTYTHQTLSSPPKRPKSPTTARESLNAVLVRHPRDEDEEGYDEDSLDRLIRNAQRFEAGSSYFSRTPPKSPSHPYTLPLPPTSSTIKSKNTHNKKGFPALKSLFPPSPPPSSPSNPGSSSPDAGSIEHTQAGYQYNQNHNSRSFDVNRVSEKLKTQKGRICFEEVEGVGQPVFAGNESDDEDDVCPGQSNGRNANGNGKGARPGTGRRWTLPF